MDNVDTLSYSITFTPYHTVVALFHEGEWVYKFNEGEWEGGRGCKASHIESVVINDSIENATFLESLKNFPTLKKYSCELRLVQELSDMKRDFDRYTDDKTTILETGHIDEYLENGTLTFHESIYQKGGFHPQ